MNMQEVIRLIRALRAEGWAGDSIDDLLLYIEGGEGEYKPRSSKTIKTDSCNSSQ